MPACAATCSRTPHRSAWPRPCVPCTAAAARSTRSWRWKPGPKPTRSTSASARSCAWPAKACPRPASPSAWACPTAPCATTCPRRSASSARPTASKPTASPASGACCERGRRRHRKEAPGKPGRAAAGNRGVRGHPLGVLLGAQRFIADANQVAHTRQVIAHIDAYEVRLREAEAAQRGYLLTGNVDYLAEYRANRQQLAPLLDELARLVADNPEQQRRVGHLRPLGDQRLGQIDRNLQRYHQEGLAAAQSAIGDEVLKLSGSIRAQARQLLEREQQLLAERDRSSRRSADLLRALAVLGIPFGLLVVTLVYLRMGREIRRRAHAERGSADANARLRESGPSWSVVEPAWPNSTATAACC